MNDSELKDVQALITILFPLAEALIVRYRELQPFAGATTQKGEFISVGEHSKTEQLTDDQLVSHLKDALRKGSKDYVAGAILYDVRTKDNATGLSTDAIAIYAEHCAGSSAYEFFYPYSFSENGIAFGESYGYQVPRQIF